MADVLTILLLNSYRSIFVTPSPPPTKFNMFNIWSVWLIKFVIYGRGAWAALPGTDHKKERPLNVIIRLLKKCVHTHTHTHTYVHVFIGT